PVCILRRPPHPTPVPYTTLFRSRVPEVGGAKVFVATRLSGVDTRRFDVHADGGLGEVLGDLEGAGEGRECAADSGDAGVAYGETEHGVGRVDVECARGKRGHGNRQSDLVESCTTYYPGDVASCQGALGRGMAGRAESWGEDERTEVAVRSRAAGLARVPDRIGVAAGGAEQRSGRRERPVDERV